MSIEMAVSATRSSRLRQYGQTRSKDIWKRLGEDNLWKRMIKNVITTTIIVALSLIHLPNSIFGNAVYLAAMMSVFAHPGRRLGQLVEALILSLFGGILGIGWSILGIYLGSLVYGDDESAAYTVRGIFLVIALLFHGYLRSHTPRLFLMVLLFIIVCITGFTTTSTHFTLQFLTQFIYPISMAAGVIFVVNLCIFPEFSSNFLGTMTIETLHDVSIALNNAGDYFIGNERVEEAKVEKTPSTGKTAMEADDSSESTKKATLSLQKITVAKARLRSKLGKCVAAQNECQFELAFAVLPPRKLRPVSKESMGKMIANVISVIDACESRAALLGDLSTSSEETSPNSDQTRPSKRTITNVEGHATTDLERVKPQREIEFGDTELFKSLLERIKLPYVHLHDTITRVVEVVETCLAFSFDVAKLPSGEEAPKIVSVEAIDEQSESLKSALRVFDIDCTTALDSTTLSHEESGGPSDVMPREEVFLISSFLLNIRQASTHLEQMLQHSRHLILLNQERRGKRRLYLPKIHWRKWLYSGGEEDESLPSKGRQPAREGSNDQEYEDDAKSAAGSEENLVREKKEDVESGRGKNRAGDSASRPQPQTSDGPTDNRPSHEQSASSRSVSNSLTMRIRGRLADVVDWLKDSEDVSYALKLTIACMLVTFPALIPNLNYFFYLSRGTWATLQLVFVFEVAIGTSIQNFIIRGVGTTLGSLWGWAAFEAGRGDPYVCTAMLFIGLIPAVYVQLGSKYPKAGMVGIISMTIVALSSELHTVPGNGTENFLKRWLAFMVGGAVALIVEMVLLPVKARTRMIESLATAIKQIGSMEACIAYGVETGADLSGGFPPAVFARFNRASGKAKTALSAAETFLPFCSVEPRLKGSFAGLAVIYREIIFVLHQIIDRMNNMFLLRTAYGSGPLEDFNTELYPYRRNAAGAVTLVLYAVHEALTTKLPLPQFLPSARLAHLRMINKVRSIIHRVELENSDNSDGGILSRRQTMRRKYLSWNAASAARAEIIEYLEELTDLTKLLVGANEFRSGLLMRPTYREYVEKGGRQSEGAEDEQADREAKDEVKEPAGAAKLKKLRSPTVSIEDDDEVPASLMRIQSRKMEAGIRRRGTNET